MQSQSWVTRMVNPQTSQAGKTILQKTLLMVPQVRAVSLALTWSTEN